MSEIKLPEGQRIEQELVKLEVTPEVEPDFLSKTIAQVEREHVLRVLEALKNKKRAAIVLGISIKNLYDRIDRYGLREKYINEYDKKEK